jgi:hypothetical protein
MIDLYAPTAGEIAALEAARAAHREAEAVYRATHAEIAALEASMMPMRARLAAEGRAASVVERQMRDIEDRIGVSLPAQITALRAWCYGGSRTIVISEDGRAVAGLEGRGAKMRMRFECFRGQDGKWHIARKGRMVVRRDDIWEGNHVRWHEDYRLIYDTRYAPHPSPPKPTGFSDRYDNKYDDNEYV